ncbi:MAG: transcriptional coactivator p15/PC4 family protein [Pseudomonadota bacterium]
MAQTIGEIPKNTMEKVVANLVEYKGKPRVDIRVYFQPNQAEPDTWIPTKKGINLDPDSWQDFKGLVGKIDKAISSDE